MNVVTIRADARSLPLADASHRACVTSPPYWGMRDYGHSEQIGMESTPQEWVGNCVKVFREVRRVLTEDGTLWLNVGDTFAGSGKGAWKPGRGQKEAYVPDPGGALAKMARTLPPGCKRKDMIGLPWMLAFALRDDGWWLRCDVIWNKPNAKPENVTGRPSRSHEYVFLLTKSSDALWNEHEAREGAVGGGLRRLRSVWDIYVRGFRGTHRATFPIDLARRAILLSTIPGDRVLDPFGGSGTVAYEAPRLGRSATVVDIAAEPERLVA